MAGLARALCSARGHSRYGGWTSACHKGESQGRVSRAGIGATAAFCARSSRVSWRRSCDRSSVLRWCASAVLPGAGVLTGGWRTVMRSSVRRESGPVNGAASPCAHAFEPPKVQAPQTTATRTERRLNINHSTCVFICLILAIKKRFPIVKKLRLCPIALGTPP